MVQTRTDPGLTPELRKLRGEITELVERVRSTVADLRRADTTTVMDHVHRIVTELGEDAPRVVVAIDERSAADGATAAEVGSVLVEAVRNAARHSGATQIRIEGNGGRRQWASWRWWTTGKGSTRNSPMPGTSVWLGCMNGPPPSVATSASRLVPVPGPG